jgi:sortase A
VHVLGRVSRVPPRGVVRSFSKLEKILLISGIFLVSVYVANRFYSGIYSQASVQSFWAQQTSSPILAEVQSKQRSETPDFRLWSEKRIRAYQASLAANVAPPLGVLEISTLHLQVPVLEGTDELTLDRGVGHISGTGSLGGDGNIGIAGHRDGFFRVLKDIHVGDTIDVHTHSGRSRYVVDEIQIVSPDDVSVLAPRAKPSLTLVTCYPFYFVGSAPSRYVVHATLAYGDEAKARIDGRTN